MPRVPPVTIATRAMPSSLLNDGKLKGRSTKSVPPSALSSASLSLYAHRDAHAAADAQRGEALLEVALLHLVQQRHQHAGARGADRVTDRDRAAVDVDLRGIPAEVLVDGAG